MQDDMKRTLYAFIVLPYVIKVFKRDFLSFEADNVIKFNNPLLDKIDTAINSAQDDLSAVKRQIYNEFHMKVRNLGKQDGNIRFDWQTPNDSGDIKLTPEQLRDLTGDMMRLYLYGMLSKDFVPSERGWKVD